MSGHALTDVPKSARVKVVATIYIPLHTFLQHVRLFGTGLPRVQVCWTLSPWSLWSTQPSAQQVGMLAVA